MVKKDSNLRDGILIRGWTQEDETVLLEARQSDRDWDWYQKKFPNKSLNALKSKWERLCQAHLKQPDNMNSTIASSLGENPNLCDGIPTREICWTPEDKAVLLEAKQSNRDWDWIQKKFPMRTLKALKLRWEKLRQAQLKRPDSMNSTVASSLGGNRRVDEVTENVDKTESRSRKTRKRLDELVEGEVEDRAYKDAEDGHGKRPARSKRKKLGSE